MQIPHDSLQFRFTDVLSFGNYYWCGTNPCRLFSGEMVKRAAGGMLPGHYSADLDTTFWFETPSLSYPRTTIYTSIYPKATINWEVQPSKTFALIVGVNDQANLSQSGSRPKLMDKAMATTISETLSARGVDTKLLVADITENQSVTKDQISQALNEIHAHISSGDTLIVYIGGHGSGRINKPEAIKLGPLGPGGTTPDSTLLYDWELTRMLSQFGDVQKLTFLDPCHAGGFWDKGDGENEPQLQSLPNIALFAAAPEPNVTAFPANGSSPFGAAVNSLMNAGLENFSYDEIQAKILEKATTSYRNSEYPPDYAPPEPYYEKEFGDPIRADFVLTTFSAASADFGADGFGLVGSPVPSVPELPPIAGFLLGLPVCYATLRRGANRRDREGALARTEQNLPLPSAARATSTASATENGG